MFPERNRERKKTMKKNWIAFLIVLLILALAFPAAAEKKEAVFGGNGNDIARGMLALKDGGYLIYGSTTSTNGAFARSEEIGEGHALWAMKLDSELRMRWNALLPDEGERIACIHDACEAEDGRILLLADSDNTLSESQLFFLTQEGELNHQECLMVDHGALCAIKGGIAVIGRHTLEDSGDRRLMLIQLHFENESINETIFRYEAERGVALLEKDGVLWGMAEEKKQAGNRVIATFNIIDEEEISIKGAQTWAMSDTDLTGLGVVPYNGTMAFIGFCPADINNHDAELIQHEEIEHDGWFYLCIVPGKKDTICAAVFYEDDNFCVLGYRGNSHSDIPVDGDTAVAYYRDKSGGFIATKTQQTTPGGMRYVNGIREGKIIRLLGMKTTAKNGIDVFIYDWEYQQ